MARTEATPATADRPGVLPEDLIETLNERFEGAHPTEILEWALLDSGLELAMASAFQAEGTVVMHMAQRIRPGVPILFLDTGFHFEETLEFKRLLTERLALNVVELEGDHRDPEKQAAAFGERLYERDPDRCCEINKVKPLTSVLRTLDAWITAFRRNSSPSRADSPIVSQYELEPGKPIVKVNPMATWTIERVWDYLREHDLPHNPLYDVGYAQVGCAPCTRVRFEGEPERAGRWADMAKWECGIHKTP